MDNSFDEVEAQIIRLREAVVDVQSARVGEVLANVRTLAQLAQEYGYAGPTGLDNLRRRFLDFPEPISRYGRADVFWKPDVTDFVERHRLDRS